MKRPKHEWQTLPREPFTFASALNGPSLTWREECSKCGTKKGTRREATQRGRLVNVYWRDVWLTSGGDLFTKAPACLAEVSDA